VNKIIIKTQEELDKWRKSIKSDINFVPTMGNLHEGHKELIKEAKNSSRNITLVSVFINPLQFDNKEDLKNYPKLNAMTGFNSIIGNIREPRNSNYDFLISRIVCSIRLCTIFYSRRYKMPPKMYFSALYSITYPILRTGSLTR